MPLQRGCIVQPVGRLEAEPSVQACGSVLMGC